MIDYTLNESHFSILLKRVLKAEAVNGPYFQLLMTHFTTRLQTCKLSFEASKIGNSSTRNWSWNLETKRFFWNPFRENKKCFQHCCGVLGITMLDARILLTGSMSRGSWDLLQLGTNDASEASRLSEASLLSSVLTVFIVHFPTTNSCEEHVGCQKGNKQMWEIYQVHPAIACT